MNLASCAGRTLDIARRSERGPRRPSGPQAVADSGSDAAGRLLGLPGDINMVFCSCTGQRRKLPRALTVQPHAPAQRPAEVTQEEAVSAAVQRRYSLG